MIEDVHVNDIEITAGKTRIAEYSQVPAGVDRPEREVLATGEHKFGSSVQLIAQTAGWVPAGSVMRWDNGAYRVRWIDRTGAYQGKAFLSLEPAQAYFDFLTARSEK